MTDATSDETHEGRLEFLWHRATFKARCGDLRPLTRFLREQPSDAGSVDLARLADVLDGSLKLRGPSKNPDVYVLASRGKTEQLVSLLRDSGLSGDVPDLWFIANLFEKKRSRGRPTNPKLKRAVARELNSRQVEDLRRRLKYGVERAVHEVARDSCLSESLVMKDYYAWRRAPSLQEGDNADDSSDE